MVVGHFVMKLSLIEASAQTAGIRLMILVLGLAWLVGSRLFGQWRVLGGEALIRGIFVLNVALK